MKRSHKCAWVAKRGLSRAIAIPVSWVMVALGLDSGFRWLRRTLLQRFRVVILVYHRVGCHGHGGDMTVSLSRFRRHLDYLRRHYAVVHLEEAVEQLSSSTRPNRDLAVITFDDGYRDNLLVADPELRRRNLPATLFATTRFIDRTESPWFLRARSLVELLRSQPPVDRAAESSGSDIVALALSQSLSNSAALTAVVERLKAADLESFHRMLSELQAAAGVAGPLASPVPLLTWNELTRLVRNGFRIGSHTLSHPILSKLPCDNAAREIGESRTVLQERLGRSILTFAYPNGKESDFTDANVMCVRKLGYLAACTTVVGFNYPGGDVFRLRRIGLGNDPLCLFAAKVEGLLLPAYRLLAKTT